MYDNSWRIPGKLKVGGLLRFRRTAVEAWLGRLEAEAADATSDGRVLDRVSQLVAQAGLPASRAPGVPTQERKARAAPRQRGRRRPWQVPSQELPP